MSVDEVATDIDLEAGLAEIKARGTSARRAGRDPVNLPMIRSWQEALGDDDPRPEAEGTAPPAMIQVWTMAGLHGGRAWDDPLGASMKLLDTAGFTSVVATNCTQTYHRYLRVGEELTVSTELQEFRGPKRTALGEGWFVTTRNVWFVGDEPVAEMLFRVLKFRPPEPAPAAAEPQPERPAVIPPVVSLDTEFFWDGTAARELRIQRCNACGALRTPPGPLCTVCGSDDRGYVVAAGTGTVYSYVVHHHPPVPGRTPPYVVALVELPEGVRIMGEVLGAGPGDVAVGTALALDWDDRGDVVLPAWRKL